MPPRPSTTAASKKPAGSSSLKALDEFLEKSNAAPGEVLGTEAQATLDAHNKAIREKYFDQFSVQAI